MAEVAVLPEHQELETFDEVHREDKDQPLHTVTHTAHKGCEFGKLCCTCIKPACGCLANNEVDSVEHAEKVSQARKARRGN